jgi:D-cysteine desulfhydrase
VKEDGAFGAGAWGGNKVRKLEWLIPDARRRGRRSILTFGGLGTNWGLATALYARDHGLATALALVDQPIDAHVTAQLARLDACGARIYRTRTKARTVAALPWLLARNARGGRLPYLLPAGGSSAVGVLGYIEAALEIAVQVGAGSLPEPAHAVVAVGTGGTAAGLALGFQLAGLRTRVVGVVVNDQLRLDAPVLARLARRSAALLARRGADLGQPRLEPDMLDLTRTAKAMAGLLALRAGGRLAARCCSCTPTGRARELSRGFPLTTSECGQVNKPHGSCAAPSRLRPPRNRRTRRTRPGPPRRPPPAPAAARAR